MMNEKSAQDIIPSDGLSELVEQLVSKGLCPETTDCRKILEAIVSQGYSIEKKQPVPADSFENYRAVHQRLKKEASSLSVGRLRELYLNRDKQLWLRHPDLFLLVADVVLQQGKLLLAYDIFSTGVETLGDTPPLNQPGSNECKTAVALIQGQAKALAQSGAHSSARALLELLINHGFTDSETMGLLGRTYKDLAFSSSDDHRLYLGKAFTTYFKAYHLAKARNDQDGAYYNGINAATLAFFSDDRQRSIELAREVEQLCLTVREQQGDNADSFWIDATLGEAVLLQGDIDRAWEHYTKACEKAGSNLFSLSAIIRQARRILAHGNIQTNRAPGPCVLPSVMVFSGHIIDADNRTQPRFPVSEEGEIAEKIRMEINRLRGKVGYAAAAAGSDILFLEAMVAGGGEIHIVLPIPAREFKKQSVRPAGHDWEQRFDALLARADSLTILDEFNPQNFVNSLEFTNTYLFGIALIRSEQIGTDLHPLAVWDPSSPGGKGGTASMIRLWQRQQIEYSIIPLKYSGNGSSKAVQDRITPETRLPGLSSAPTCGCLKKVKHHAFLPMLFADVKGYSRLSENEAICFSGSFLARMAQVLEQYQDGILSKRTVGDGLFLVFYGLEPAIQVARDLQEMINTHNWQEDGLPADLQMRISLDAGPCYSYTDPIMDKIEFFGNYVIRAARMEPITPPGHIYASDTFVALCRAEGLGQGSFSYAGQVILPKDYGRLAVYHVNLLHDKTQ
ncbi:MAG: TRAFs-binding domain-containing protein [Desulfobulbaceae bacterium]|nr:TRAFs-binding domain-containing protein [Desulfobulbaceae bacterium]